MEAGDTIILDRSRNLKRKGFVDKSEDGRCMGYAEESNPLCGDLVSVQVEVERKECESTVMVARFEGYGCSLCLASADLLMELAEGRSVREVLSWSIEDVKRNWGGLVVGRARAQCVMLPLEALQRSLSAALG